MPTTYIEENDLARQLKLSPRTLQRMRMNGDGAAYLKLGRRVLYSSDDVQIWIETQRRLSTSDNCPHRQSHQTA